MAPNSPETQPQVAYPPAPPRTLDKRLSPTDRDDLIAAFNTGTTQKTLAAKYGISTRSIKRLVHGFSNRPQATRNRLTTSQRDAIIHTYATTGIPQAQLARDYGVDVSTIKRILREARST
ncbi:sigma-70 family RNA polymerase sigma factor [Glycomyces dulcitolivorans]|uniref:sigma-70 family RNA polymerase sigma factor n=1 Tax=Glycomyces dulcitolivorans TaxID=2200759 RepID=UPI000DD40EAD|nr:sigma-70 family RNA polymerase sigma factor [Glycomyces dulcitolivorans]